MANDALAVPCPADVWTLVASNVVTGSYFRKNTSPGAYMQDVKVTGNPAPVDNSNAAPAFMNSNSEPIGSDAPIDVYIKAVGKDGEIVVHL